MLDGIFEAYHIKKIFNSALLLHHVVTIYILSYLRDENLAGYIYYPFFLSELSNLPMYLVYHKKSSKYDNMIMMRMFILMEALSFLILRMILGGIATFKLFFIDAVPITIPLAGILVYIMSGVWLKSLTEQLLK